MSVEDMRRDDAEVMTVTDLEGTSDVGNVEDMLHLLYSQGRMGAVYVCGSNRLMLAAQRVARRLDLFGEVALEQQMACGVGICFCCVRPFRDGDEVVHRRVCCEGPVFPLLEALEW
jgi:dihydroorotate dehydrogenase electron transfer subunit